MKTASDSKLARAAVRLAICAMAAMALTIGRAQAYGWEIGGPASQDEYTETDYTGPDAGYVVLSVSLHDAEVGINSLALDAERTDGETRTAFWLRTSNLFKSQKHDFATGKGFTEVLGDVVVRALPPGDYILSRYFAFAGANCGHSGFATSFSVPFSVKKGEAVYLGNFRFEPITWHLIWGSSCSAGGYFVVSNEEARDLPVAKTKRPQLPETISRQLPDTAALNLPMFRSEIMANKQASPTALHIQGVYTDAGAAYKEDRKKARALIAEAIASGDLTQRQLAYVHGWLGLMAYDDKDYKLAETELSESIRLEPGLDVTWGDRGLARVQQNDLDAAYSDLKMALKLSPHDALWHLHIADLEMKRNNIDNAMLHFGDAAASAPKSATVLMRRASANVKLGRYEAAEADVNAAIKTDNIKPGEAHAMLCLYGAREGHPEATIGHCDKAITLEPKVPENYCVRGFIRLGQGQTDTARADFEQALKLKSNLAEALYGRGLVRQKLGDTVGADADLAAARKAKPDVEKEAMVGLANPKPK
jgi:tetratricopeptide (TPR) repeat protein